MSARLWLSAAAVAMVVMVAVFPVAAQPAQEQQHRRLNDAMTVEGVVTSVFSSSFTIHSTDAGEITVVTDASMTESQPVPPLVTVAVGDRVLVEGVPASDGRLIAQDITILEYGGGATILPPPQSTIDEMGVTTRDLDGQADADTR